MHLLEKTENSSAKKWRERERKIKTIVRKRCEKIVATTEKKYMKE